MLNGQVMSIVVWVGALEQAHVSDSHFRCQALGLVFEYCALAGPQEIFHS
ncbi:Unknown protein sequence [Pseudomonas syringae pv. syringae]|nr:Unknown protein sequence [Pseudomonas syringae pv. syringae]